MNLTDLMENSGEVLKEFDLSQMCTNEHILFLRFFLDLKSLAFDKICKILSSTEYLNILYFVANLYVVFDIISNILFSESLIETSDACPKNCDCLSLFCINGINQKKQWYVLKHYH